MSNRGSSSRPSTFRAVVFDLGGVVLGSPLHAIAAYEREIGIPSGFINRVVMDTAPRGAWSQLERGELALPEFIPAFEADCEAAGQRISAAVMMTRIGESSGPRVEMLAAIACIKSRGLRTAALTNNWAGPEDAPAPRDSDVLRPHFDVFIESSVEGLRKPDPRIYELACDRLAISPSEAVFLDDIGANLKPARAMGFATIKVVEPAQALAELEALLEFPITQG